MLIDEYRNAEIDLHELDNWIIYKGTEPMEYEEDEDTQLELEFHQLPY